MHVRRHGGWSWGDPAAYIDPVCAAIEDALSQVAELAALPENAEVSLTDPVTLEVASNGQVTPGSLRALAAQLQAAASTHPLVEAPEPAGGESEATPGFGLEAVMAPRASLPPFAALASTLGRWSRAGRLAILARAWPSVALDAWVAALVAASRDPASTTARLPSGAVAAIAAAVLVDGGAAPRDRSHRERFLLLVGAVVAAQGDILPDRATVALIAREAGVPAGHRAQETADRTITNEAAPTVTLPVPGDVGDRARPTGPVVVPALPFLVVVQMHRLGLLEPATVALDAAGVTPAGACFAAAVAGKSLDPPRHGWLRRPEERIAVELASGLSTEQVDHAARRWVDQAEALLVPLRTGLVELYADGRGRYDELHLTRTGDGVVCGEAQGMLPIAWVGDQDELSAVTAQLGDPPVVESNVFGPLVEVLAPRRGLPGQVAPELERFLGSVVGTALGSLAQELWGQEADAVLALERLHDLEGQVRVGDRLIIGIPRGQRWLDLRGAGLLDAWPVPWAPGGVWELVTW